MSRIFDIAYVVLLLIASPWLAWRALFRGRNRRGWRQKLWGAVPLRSTDQPCVWLHAVSVGEVNLLATVIDRLQVCRPDLKFAISTTTETGFDLASSKYAQHAVFFCPFDFSWAMKRAIKRLRPDLIVLAELEVWPNLISTAHAQEIPVAVINGRLSESSFRGYQRFRWLLRPTFEKLTAVIAAGDDYANRFRAMGTAANNVFVSGSLKFDGGSAERASDETQKLRQLAELQPDDFVIVAGSTQPGENLMLTRVFRTLVSEFSNVRLVLVPRHPETCDSVQAGIERQGFAVRRRSQFGHDRASEVGAESEIVLVDVIGELSAWWGCANAGFVGGSMGGAVGGNRGGQNMIEPAACGVPVSFGPDTRNFREVVSQLMAADAATVVNDETELRAFFRQTIASPRWARDQGLRSQQFVLKHAGAADQTIEQLQKLLPPAESHRSRAA